MPDAHPPAPLPDLPSGKVAHATTFYNELNQRLFGFRAGVEALQTEMEGQETEYRDKRDKLDSEHAAKKADLLRRIDDMRNGEMMALAAIDIWNRTQEPAEAPRESDITGPAQS